MTMNAKWCIKNNLITLLLPDGSAICPNASEVVGAEFKNKMVIQGYTIEIRPSEAFPLVEFLRFPPEARIHVFPPSMDLTIRPKCSIELLVNGKVIVSDYNPHNDLDHLIIDNKWIPIVKEIISPLTECLRNSSISKPGNLTIRQYVNLIRQNMDIVYSEPTMIDIIHPAAENEFEDTISNNIINATLYPYQVSGINWLMKIVAEDLGCILADEMGLGKTIQIIALLLNEKLKNNESSLVITTATLLENWRRELKRFAPQLSVLKHRGSGRTGFPSTLKEHDIVLTTYDTAVRDLSMLKMINWNIVALDEAQSIKSPEAQRTKAIKEIPRNIGIAITGTPVENKLTDLWSLMDFSLPGLFGTRFDFERKYDNTQDDAQQLEPLISPFILRRRVADVAKDLPPRIEIPQPIELSDESARIYDRIRNDILNEYGASASLPAIMKLRMYCAHPFLLDEGNEDMSIHSTKYSRLLEIIDEICSRNEKFLIFTSFTKMADMIISDVSTRFNIKGFVLDGRVDVEERQILVDKFQELMGSAFMVLNPKAAGVGLNITEANHVIHYNLEWNPAVEDQATARAFRRGQKKPVIVYRLFYAGTIEEVMNDRVTHKRGLATNAVVGVSGGDDVTDLVRAINMSPLLI